MKKLSAIFMSVFVLIVGAFMSACGGQNVKVKFTDQDCYVEMYIGEDVGNIEAYKNIDKLIKSSKRVIWVKEGSFSSSAKIVSNVL